MDVVVTTETLTKGPTDLLPLINDYEKFASPGHPVSGSRALVLMKKNMVSRKKLVFVHPNGRLVVMDLTFSSNKVVRLIAIYAPKIGQN